MGKLQSINQGIRTIREQLKKVAIIMLKREGSSVTLRIIIAPKPYPSTRLAENHASP